jgi:hemolysin III
MSQERKRQHQPPKSSVEEEIANSVTHGVGAMLSLVGTAVLLYRAVRGEGSELHIASFAIYGTGLFLLHLSSTLYHALHHLGAKRVFWVFDHCSIYLLIAGTYTPFLLLSLWGRWGATLLATIWGLTIIGIVFQSVFIGRLRKTSVGLYVLMGWLIVIAAREVWLKVPHEALVYVAAGGLLYTAGIAFYGWRRLPFHHAIWHLFVLGGSACHYFAILFYLAP